MTPNQISKLSDVQLYISKYIALSPNQIQNLNLVQAIFGINQINTMRVNPLTPNQQDAFKQLGL